MRTRSSGRTSPLAYDPEVERSARLRRKAVSHFSTNLDFSRLEELFTEIPGDDDATGGESPPRGVDSYYRPGNFEDPLPIVYPVVANRAASNFKIQPNLKAILPVFRGYEESYAHLREFFSIADTYQFPSLEPGSIKSWSEMQSAFLDEFYSISKTAAIRNKIKSFRQIPGEQFHEAFNRLKELLRTCPHHDVPKLELVKVFYNGLNYQNQQFVMATSGGKGVPNVSQLAEEVHKREASKLPSYHALNPKHKPCGPEHVNMVTSLRNGKTYNNDIKILSVLDFLRDVEDFITDDEIVVEGKKDDNVKSNSELVNNLLKDFQKPPTHNPEATESPKVGEDGVSSTTTPYPAALEESASARLAIILRICGRLSSK
ncbi:reverse transcriptase domain-containing protein [Tanacetum coccineum]